MKYPKTENIIISWVGILLVASIITVIVLGIYFSKCRDKNKDLKDENEDLKGIETDRDLYKNNWEDCKRDLYVCNNAKCLTNECKNKECMATCKQDGKDIDTCTQECCALYPTNVCTFTTCYNNCVAEDDCINLDGDDLIDCLDNCRDTC